MTLSDLGRKSVRRNALIADLLHRIAFIEKAGTGIKRIRDEVREQGCPEPVFENNGFFTAVFRPNPEVRAMAEAQPPTQSGAQSVRILTALADGDSSARELAAAIGLRIKTGSLKRTLAELLGGRLIEYALPAKPSSRLQRYRMTQAGIAHLTKTKEKK